MNLDTIQFVDPETHEKVTRATDIQLESLRKAIQSGHAKRVDGADIPNFEGAFLTPKGDRAYLIIDGIPNFLLHERIELRSPLKT